MSLAIALTIRIGIHFGEKNSAAIRKVQILGLITATILALISMTFLWLFRPTIIALYTQDYDVAIIAMHLILFAIAYQLIDAWQVSAAGCLRGMQDTKGPMWITMIAYWMIAFPLGIYLVRYTDLGAAGVWIGLIVGLTVACILLLTRLYRNNQHIQRSFAESN